MANTAEVDAIYTQHADHCLVRQFARLCDQHEAKVYAGDSAAFWRDVEAFNDCHMLPEYSLMPHCTCGARIRY